MYAFELQQDLESVRVLLHNALTLAHTQRDRLQTRVRLLVDQLHTARDHSGRAPTCARARSATHDTGRRRRSAISPDRRRCYRLTILSLGIQLTVDRLRRDRHELVGELAVACDLAGAHTIDGYLSVADFNLSSAHARQARAKLLAERSEAPDLDWLGLVEELCVRAIAAERLGTPSRPLHTFERDPADAVFDIDGWPWLRDHAMITFADGGGLKSYLALYGAGVLARQGVAVGYVDWELSGCDHRARLQRMFGESLPSIAYLRCDRPIVDEGDRIQREVRRLGLEYLVFDSAGFATAGAPEAAEEALKYFRCVRQIGLGSHHLAHVNRSENSDQKPFGSSFWHNSARSTWFAKKSAPHRMRSDSPSASSTAKRT